MPAVGCYLLNNMIDQNYEAIKNLPDVRTLRILLDEFERKLVSCTSLAEVVIAYSGISFIPFYIQTIPYLDFKEMPFFRARQNIDENINPTILTSTFSYPYSFFCNENNRANIKRFPVFYAADNFWTAVMETKLANGVNYFVTKWKFNTTRHVRFATFLHTNTNSENKWKIFSDGKRTNKDKDYRGLFPNKAEQLDILANYWANKFLFEEPPYMATSHLAHMLLYVYEIVDFIVYPSRVTKHLATNFAFHANFVNRFGVIEKATCINVFTNNEQIDSWRFTMLGDINLNSIRWRQYSKTDRNNLSRDFHIIIA